MKQLYENSADLIAADIRAMEIEINEPINKLSIWSVLRDPTYLLPMLLVCSLMAGILLSGVDAITYYSVSILELNGMSSKEAKLYSLLSGIVTLIVALFTPLIMAKYNRRTVIIGSYLFTAIFLGIFIFLVSISVSISLKPIQLYIDKQILFIHILN